MWDAEEEVPRPYPLGKTVTSLELWLTSWATWLGFGMNTLGQTETSMSPSSEKTSSQVRDLEWSLEASKLGTVTGLGTVRRGPSGSCSRSIANGGQ